MKPRELHVYDFDHTLYNSPQAPNGNPLWALHAKSLNGWKPPGFDQRWILPVLIHARRSGLDPYAMPVILTGRPDHKPMREIIEQMVKSTDVPWASVCLKPLLPPVSDPAYKASQVGRWLRRHASVERVVFYDDRSDNLRAVGRVVQTFGRRYRAVLTAQMLKLEG